MRSAFFEGVKFGSGIQIYLEVAWKCEGVMRMNLYPKEAVCTRPEGRANWAYLIKVTCLENPSEVGSFSKMELEG